MSSDAHGLSTRELLVLQLAADGRTNAEIAKELSVSPSVVEGALDSVYMKLGVTDRAIAVAHALQAGLIS